ncbi:MAG TPA: DUF2934 domain-containing protein [Candidatus Angelobacter sp.]|jgi:hypothetical protein
MAGKPPKKSSKQTPATKATIQPVSTVTPISQPGKGGESLGRTQQPEETLVSGNKTANIETDGRKREEHTIGGQNVAEQIRLRAYELFEQRGRLEGYDREDWARAEEEILSKFQREKSA